MKYDGTLRITFLSTAFLLLALVTLSFGREDHKGYMDLKPGECTECHQGSDVVPNHGAFWMKEHRLPAQKATSNCADCHQQSWCLDCHVGGGIEPDLKKSLSRRGEYMPKTHRSDFVSIHSVKAAESAVVRVLPSGRRCLRSVPPQRVDESPPPQLERHIEKIQGGKRRKD